MVKDDLDHLFLREYSGQLMWNNSPASEYLTNLPLANAEENCRETDTRYLLPRDNIFMFGFQSGITERVRERLTLFSCKLCQRHFMKAHEVKQHILTTHSKQESSSGSPKQSLSSTPPTKSKKSTHKSKKKVVPPPSVPPPPLFPKVDFPPPATAVNVPPPSPPSEGQLPPLEDIVPPSEDLLPPVLQPAETVEENTSTSRTSPEKMEEVPTTAPSLPPTLPTQVSTQQLTVTTPTPLPKTKEKPAKVEKQNSRHKRSKKRRNSDEFDPDRHCGVVDSMKRPCLRAVTCANHTIVERRAVKGRSINVDKLISDYKASRVKTKPQLAIPISIAPKQSASLKEVRSGFQVIELIYENENQNIIRNPAVKCSDDPILASALEDLASMTHRAVATLPKEDSCVLKNLKLSGNSDSASNLQSSALYVPLSPEAEQVPSGGSKLSPGTLLKVNLSQPSPPLPITKLAEVPSPVTPTVYNLHPKPMTMSTSGLRRVGSSFVLSQTPRLDRQRVDLQAVVNQHKQLKAAAPNKTVSLLNSNHNKQSILKSNVKNNVKINLKRTSVDKPTLNDLKHMKVIATDMNGFILNANFSDNSEIQSANSVQDKITLLK